MKHPLICLLGTLALANSGASAATIIFENQFNGTWSGVNNGTPFVSMATYTPSAVGSTFTNDSDASGALWTVDTLTPQPWSAGGVIFTGGGNTTGQISTTFNTTIGLTYNVFWDVDLLGSATTTDLIASAGGQSQILSTTTPEDQSFSFTGTGSPVTLTVAINSVGANGSSDVQLDYMRVEAVPEPGALSALLGGTGVLLGLRRRRSA